MLELYQMANAIQKASEFRPSKELPHLRPTGKRTILGEVIQNSNTGDKATIAKTPYHKPLLKASSLSGVTLCNAVMSGNISAIRYLLASGHNPNQTTDGFSPLLMCLIFTDAKNIEKSLETVELFIQYGVDVNARERRASSGRTALHIACERRLLSVIDVLLRYGAAPDTLDLITGLTPLQATLQFLIDSPPKHKPVYVDITLTLLRYSTVDVTQCSVTPDEDSIVTDSLYGYYINPRPSHSPPTPLKLAIQSAQLTVITTIISKGSSRFQRSEVQEALTLMCRYKGSQQDKQSVVSLLTRELYASCPSLQQLCRDSIRSQMSRKLSQVDQIPTFNSFKRYILLETDRI